jgi:hypothetical protein
MTSETSEDEYEGPRHDRYHHKIALEGALLGHYAYVYRCKHCKAQVRDLPDAIYVEWWADDDCGCERDGE